VVGLVACDAFPANGINELIEHGQIAAVIDALVLANEIAEQALSVGRCRHSGNPSFFGWRPAGSRQAHTLSDASLLIGLKSVRGVLVRHSVGRLVLSLWLAFMERFVDEPRDLDALFDALV